MRETLCVVVGGCLIYVRIRFKIMTIFLSCANLLSVVFVFGSENENKLGQ